MKTLSKTEQKWADEIISIAIQVCKEQNISLSRVFECGHSPYGKVGVKIRREVVKKARELRYPCWLIAQTLNTNSGNISHDSLLQRKEETNG